MKTLSIAIFTLIAFVETAHARRMCEVSMETRRGRVIREFREFGRDACHYARRECREALWRRQRNGRNPYATCRVTRRRGDELGRRQVTRTCRATLHRRNGRRIDSFSAQATGRRGSGVKGRACQKALRRCERNAIRAQYCQIRR